MDLELFCDGASRGNPGPSAYGFVVYSQGSMIREKGAPLGTITNNEAEYHGLLAGLEECAKLGATSLTVKADSELMVRQLNGQYKVKAPNLIPLFQRAKDLLKNFKTLRIEHVRRESNKAADALANQALDENQVVYHSVV